DNPPGETAPTWDEINHLAGVLAAMTDSPRAMLERACRLLADSLRTAHVRIVSERHVAAAGDHGAEPALAEPIVSQGRTLGKILVAGRSRSPFTKGEIDKLHHYGRLLAHLLDAAEQQQQWQRLALIDEATGLPNRRYLMQRLEEILHQATIEQF